MSHVSLNDDCIAPRASRFPKRRRQKASARPLKGLHSRSSFCRARGVKRTWRGCFLKEKSQYVHGKSHSADYPPFFPSAPSIQPLFPLVGYVGTENYLPRLDRNKIWRIHPVHSTCSRTQVLAHNLFPAADNCLTSDYVKDLLSTRTCLIPRVLQSGRRNLRI